MPIQVLQSVVQLAFRRYATSKISNLSDLANISSLGFRGEAVSSIVAVAGVEIFTKTSSEAAGTFMCLRNGHVVRREPRARPNEAAATARNESLGGGDHGRIWMGRGSS